MIDVDELRALIRFDQMPLTDIEEIFRALVNYPAEEAIRNPTRDELTRALDAACEALIGDNAELPSGTAAAIARLAPVFGHVDPHKQTYSTAANFIREDPTAWHEQLRK